MLLWLTGLVVTMDIHKDIVNDLDIFSFAVPDPNAPKAIKSIGRSTTTLCAIMPASADPP
eukprot:1692334-Ditylum_brightwellii.AAC.1